MSMFGFSLIQSTVRGFADSYESSLAQSTVKMSYRLRNIIDNCANLYHYMVNNTRHGTFPLSILLGYNLHFQF